MKKIIVLIAGMILLTTVTEAAASQQLFLDKMDNAIYHGTRSGRLTKHEVKGLNGVISDYEKMLWKYERNGKLSKRERRKLLSKERDIERRLKSALFNQHRTNRAKSKKKNSNVVQEGSVKRRAPICRMPSRSSRIEKY